MSVFRVFLSRCLWTVYRRLCSRVCSSNSSACSHAGPFRDCDQNMSIRDGSGGGYFMPRSANTYLQYMHMYLCE